MKLKRMIVAILLLSMAFSTVGFTAAVNSDELTKVILAVKSKITVPEDYTEFEYYYNQDEWEQGKYNLIWNNKKDGYRALYIEADPSGNILSYHQYQNEEIRFNEKEVLSKEDAIQIASEFLYKVNETAKDRFFYDEAQNIAGSFQVSFQEKIGGIPVKGSTANVTIHKSSGQVMNMRVARNYSKDDFKDASKAISLEEAKAAYIKEFGINISYNLYSDWEKKTISSFPAYGVSDYGVYAIDALTGKKIKAQENFFPIFRNSKDMVAEEKGYGGLSESEKVEVSNTLKLLTKEEALKAVNTYFGDGIAFEINSANLGRNSFDKDAYQWNISGIGNKEVYFSATVDAVTGTVLNFHFSSDKKGENKITEADAYNKVKKILESNAKSIFNKFKAREIIQDEKAEGFTFSFDRYENGLKVNGNSIDVQVSMDGNITSYFIVYNDKITFNPVSSSKEIETVFDTFSKHGSFGLYYYPVHSYDETLKKQVVTMHLIYDFLEKPRVLDPKTLEQLDEKGKVYKDKQNILYQDLSDHWVKQTVNLLAYNNFYMISEEQFQPDLAVTQRDFLTFILKTDHIEFDSDEKLYDYAIRVKLILESEINPTALVSRKEAARFLIRMLGFERLTKRPEIFAYPYADSVDAAYKPYISLCYALSLLNGDTANQFNPEQGLTRGECAVIILNLFKSI